jgi:hypothetical protein
MITIQSKMYDNISLLAGSQLSIRMLQTPIFVYLIAGMMLPEGCAMGEEGNYE